MEMGSKVQILRYELKSRGVPLGRPNDLGYITPIQSLSGTSRASYEDKRPRHPYEKQISCCA
jgi:hypothetical protein